MLTEVSPLSESTCPCKTNEGVYGRDNNECQATWGGTSWGFPRAILSTPPTVPMSQNCDYCRPIPPKASPSRIGIGPSRFLGVILRLQRACVSLALSLGKTSPVLFNGGLSELLANFNNDAKGSVGQHFLESFSSERCHPLLQTWGCRNS
jgi:hypothetical protein